MSNYRVASGSASLLNCSPRSACVAPIKKSLRSKSTILALALAFTVPANAKDNAAYPHAKEQIGTGQQLYDGLLTPS